MQCNVACRLAANRLSELECNAILVAGSQPTGSRRLSANRLSELECNAILVAGPMAHGLTNLDTVACPFLIWSTYLDLAEVDACGARRVERANLACPCVTIVFFFYDFFRPGSTCPLPMSHSLLRSVETWFYMSMRHLKFV